MKRLLVLLLVVPALAACGGSSTPTAAPTTTAPASTTAAPAASSVQASANAICVAYHRALAAYNQPQTMPGIAVYYAAVHRALARMVARLEALQPQDAALKAYVAATRAELGPVADIRTQALAGSMKGIRKVAIRGALLDKKAHALAVKAKLDRCAETPASS